MASATVYIFPMRKKECEWDVIRMRARGEHLCTVTAADEEAALKLAMKQFALDAAEATRLLVRKALKRLNRPVDVRRCSYAEVAQACIELIKREGGGIVLLCAQAYTLLANPRAALRLADQIQRHLRYMREINAGSLTARAAKQHSELTQLRTIGVGPSLDKFHNCFSIRPSLFQCDGERQQLFARRFRPRRRARRTMRRRAHAYSCSCS
jgi:hypothetical protein